jgi:hypothetical protein
VTTTERFSRHGDILTYVIYTDDPVYLSQPFARSRNFVRMSGIGEGNWIAATPCEPGEETVSAPHQVPHYLPGANPFVAEAATRIGLPPDVIQGGAETIYPEYRERLRANGRR